MIPWRWRGAGKLSCLWLWTAGCGVVPLFPNGLRMPPNEDEPISARSELATEKSCDNLCTLTLLHCKNENRAYASYDACMQSCAGITEEGEPGATSGDSVQCRLTYALMARHTLTMWFCQNASPTGGLQCL